jgi:hypothetical protein
VQAGGALLAVNACARREARRGGGGGELCVEGDDVARCAKCRWMDVPMAAPTSRRSVPRNMWRLAARAAPRLRGAAAARGFADAKPPAAKAAAAVEDVVVPLKLFGLPARYASALYVAATKAAALPTVEKELNTVVELAAANANFGAFLADPSLTKADKLKGINTILENGKFSATTKQFFCACPRPPPARARVACCASERRVCAHFCACMPPDRAFSGSRARQPCWRRTGGWATRTTSWTSSRSS